jgi:sodium/potassium-transporting ATPase subunit beta
MPVDVGTGVGTAIRPIERHGWEAISFFLYDPAKGAFMGRTPKSWFLITIFYIVYYICLAAFWALCMFVFLQTIDEKVPKWITDESLIGSSGALGIRPRQSDEFIDSSMITFNKDSKDSGRPGEVAGWEEWATRTNEFLAKYRSNTAGVDCKNGEAGNDEFCKFPLQELKGCGQMPFGYDQGKPCVYLKMNKIYGLTHSYYNETKDLPDNIPAHVRSSVSKATGDDANQIWIDCHGENPSDKEGLGEVKYFPESAGLPAKYFPYMRQPGYLGPLVAVQFTNPNPGQLLHIECRAYAKNIDYDKRDKLGIAHFELMVHNDMTAKATDKEL